ncbi:hypothetical protein QTP88_016248 [Uroleucon formosanum]
MWTSGVLYCHVDLQVLIEDQHTQLALARNDLELLQTAERENTKTVPADSQDLAADEEAIEHSALCALIGIYFNLITKKLTLQNINQWYKQRIKAYTKGASTAENMSEFEKFKLNLQFAQGVTSTLSSCHDIKRLIFFLVRG